MDNINKDAKRAASRYGIKNGIGFADLLAAQDVSVSPRTEGAQVTRLGYNIPIVAAPLQCDPAILTPSPERSVQQSYEESRVAPGISHLSIEVQTIAASLLPIDYGGPTQPCVINPRPALSEASNNNTGNHIPTVSRVDLYEHSAYYLQTR